MANKQDSWQVASNGLAAFAQVYGFRVDSVHSEIFKIMGGLHRNDKTAEDENEEGNLENLNELKKKNQKNIEQNKVKLELKKFDLDNQVDPLFKHTTAKFSQINAKGLLSYVLEVDSKLFLVLEGKIHNDEEMRLADLTIDNIIERDDKAKEEEINKADLISDKHSVNSNIEVDTKMKFKEKQENTFIKTNKLKNLITNLRGEANLDDMDLCISLNDFKKRILNNSGHSLEETPNKISNISLIRDDVRLLSKLDKTFSQQVIERSNGSEEGFFNKLQSEENNIDIDIDDRNDLDIEVNANDDVSIASISYNDLQSESNSKAHSMSFQVGKHHDFNQNHQMPGLIGNINPNELQQHMLLIGKGGVDFFDTVRMRKFDNKKLNWEREVTLNNKENEEKKEEKKKKAQKLYNFCEEAEIDNEIFLKKDQKKKNFHKKKADRKKNKQFFNYNQFLTFSLFSNPDIILSNDFKLAINNNRPLQSSNDNNINKEEITNEEEEKIIRNDQFEDLNNYNNDNEEEGFIVDENIYDNERYSSAQKLSLRSNSNDNRARLEQIYKIVNVRKIKSEIMNKLDNNTSNKTKKPYDFITLVNSMNTDNVNNKNKTYNEATCFVSLLHLCNEKSKILY